MALTAKEMNARWARGLRREHVPRVVGIVAGLRADAGVTVIKRQSARGARHGAFEPLLYGVGLAIVLPVFLKETGPAVRRLAL